MSPEMLLRHFEKISEAPDAVLHLRNFVLDLSVRGKIVAQDQSDEPASALVARVGASKREANQERSRKISDTDFGEYPYPVPKSWSWSLLSDLSLRIHYGYTASANPILKDVKLLRITDIQNGRVDWDAVPGCEIKHEQIAKYALSDADFLIARTGGTVGKSFLIKGVIPKAVFASYLIRVQFPAMLFDRYLKLFFDSPVYWKQLKDGTRGAGQPNVNGQTLGRMKVPVPPIAEQKRIVAKTDELMALCDELEAAQQNRERCRNRLVTASLKALHGGQSGSNGARFFQDSATFYFNQLPRLTARPEHTKQLRDTIVDLAVRGRFTSPRTRLDSASELLERIDRERRPAILAGKVKEWGKTRSNRTDDEPYPLPTTWRWASLGQLIVFGPQNGVSPKESNDHNSPKALTLTATTSGRFDPRHYKHVELSKTDCDKYWLEPGDVLVQRGNTREYVGTAAVYAGPHLSFVFPDLMIRIRFSSALDLRFILLQLLSPHLRSYFAKNATGASSSMPKISQGILMDAPLAIPPLGEQHRIVQKADELIGICDELEVRLADNANTRRSLLEATLYKALNATITEN